MNIHFPERVFSDILNFMQGFYILYNKDGDIIKQNQSVPRSFPRDLDNILLSSTPCLDEKKSNNFKMYTDSFQSYTIYIYNYNDYNSTNELGWLVVGFLHQNELTKLLDIVSIGVMKFDLSFKPIYLNTNSENIFGHSQEELWNMGFERIFGRGLLLNFQEHINKNPYLTQPFETVTNALTPLGRKKVLSVKIYSIYEYSISSLAYYTVISDITQEYNSNLKLRYLTNHDSLTNLYNRSALTKEITEAVETQDIKQSALLYVDADEFKAINDTYGHNTGDEVLKYIASQLVNSSKSGDVVARVGGDEFIVFLHNVLSSEDAFKRGKDIAKSINGQILVENHKVKVQCSIGCSFNSDLEEITSSTHISVDEWLKLADIAMYESKKSRKGEVVLFDHKLYRRQIDIKNCVEHLHRVINDDLGSIVFQPIYRKGRIESIEALGRVGDKEKSICLNIEEAIDIASSNGIKYQLFKYLFELGFKSYKNVIDGIENPPSLNINLPIELLSNGDFVE